MTRSQLEHHLVDRATLERRLATTPLEQERRVLLFGLVERDFRECAPGATGGAG